MTSLKQKLQEIAEHIQSEIQESKEAIEDYEIDGADVQDSAIQYHKGKIAAYREIQQRYLKEERKAEP